MRVKKPWEITLAQIIYSVVCTQVEACTCDPEIDSLFLLMFFSDRSNTTLE